MFSSFFQIQTIPESNRVSNFKTIEIFSPLVPLFDKLDKKQNELSTYIPQENNNSEIQDECIAFKKYKVISKLNQNIHFALDRFNELPGNISYKEEKDLINNLQLLIENVIETNYELLSTRRGIYKKITKNSLEVGTFVVGATLIFSGLAFFPASITGLALYGIYYMGASKLTGETIKYIDANINDMPETLILLSEILLKLNNIDLSFKIKQTEYEALPNYYNILEINTDATIEQIKKAFHQKALIYHPDKLINKELTDLQVKEFQERFIILSQAYECLSDPSLKSVYDEKYFEKNRVGQQFSM